jgi:hypothetical protein
MDTCLKNLTLLEEVAQTICTHVSKCKNDKKKKQKNSHWLKQSYKKKLMFLIQSVVSPYSLHNYLTVGELRISHLLEQFQTEKFVSYSTKK